eukprot:2822671-Rhodomonas_salina.1
MVLRGARGERVRDRGKKVVVWARSQELGLRAMRCQNLVARDYALLISRDLEALRYGLSAKVQWL